MSAPPATDTLLDWALAPSPDPAQAGRALALRFVADVPEGRDQVFCDRITFAFDIEPGPPQDGTYLTGDGTGIGVIVDPPDHWDLDGARTDGTFSFVRPPGIGRLVTGSYTFVLHGIKASPVVGKASVTIRESAAEEEAGTYEERERSFDVEKFPPAFEKDVRFSTDRTSVDPGGVVNLTWSGDPDAKYELYVEGRSRPIDLTNQPPPWKSDGLRHATVFTLTVSGSQNGQDVTLNCYLPVFVDVPTVTLRGDKTSMRRGDDLTLSWETEYVTDLTLKGPGAPGPLTDPPPLVVQPTKPDAHYVLSGRTSKGPVQQSEFSVSVAQPAPVAVPSLVLVKYVGVPRVTVCMLSGASGFQQMTTAVTDFRGSDGPKGTWVITPYDFNAVGPDLVFIKTRDGNGSVRVFYRTWQTNYQEGLAFPSSFTEDFGPKGTWLAAKMVAARRYLSPDLVLVETAWSSPQEALTPVLVHARTFESAFRPPVPGSPWSTPFVRQDAAKGTWLIADMAHDGMEHLPDLVFVQTVKTASGMVELSYASGASGYRSRSKTYVTGFDAGDAHLGTFLLADMNGDGRQDLVFVKTQNTDSERVEIYWALAGDGYVDTTGGFTMLSTADGKTGTWQLAGDP